MPWVIQFIVTAQNLKYGPGHYLIIKECMTHRTNTTKTMTVGTLGAEKFMSYHFNEKNLKELFSKRESDTEISFAVKDEAQDRGVSIFREPSIHDTLKLFIKPFKYLYEAE